MDTTLYTDIAVEAWQVREGDLVRDLGSLGTAWRQVVKADTEFSDNPILDDWIVLRTESWRGKYSPGVWLLLRVPNDWIGGHAYRRADSCECVERLRDGTVETVRVFSCDTHGTEVPGFGGWNQQSDPEEED